MKRPELLAPAGSYEAMVAAVQNGADAVYMGFGEFNARRGAKNLTTQEMQQAVEYCRLRGVKTNITMNTLLTDRELDRAQQLVEELNRIGADAVIVADWGLARIIRALAPELDIHASTQTTLHSLDGVKYAAEHGFSRVVLSRELSRAQIEHICAHSPVEIEVFAHGALCMCYSGQCYLSGVIGSRSGNRGMCAQPCRLPYGFNGKSRGEYPLSLKDLCLADRLCELRDMGVDCIKLEGRMKRPEYVATVTRIYSQLLREQRRATPEELSSLEQVFSRQGFTCGYYEARPGAHMFGIRHEPDEVSLNALYKQARESCKGEKARVGVSFSCVLNTGENAQLTAQDDAGNRCTARGAVVERAHTRGISPQAVEEQLRKTGGTPYFCQSVQVSAAPDAAVPISAVNALRRECLEELSRLRITPPRRSHGELIPEPHPKNSQTPPELTVSVMQIEQVTRDMLNHSPALVCIPLHLAAADPGRTAKLAEQAPLAVTLPRIITDTQQGDVQDMLRAVRELGVADAMVGNPGHFTMVKCAGLNLRCDFGLNVFNSRALCQLEEAGALSAVLSPELTFPQIRDIGKPIPTELIVYGRLPLMITENCVVKAQSRGCTCQNHNQLTDRTGAEFPLVREYPHRNVILNSRRLFLADKPEEYSRLGLWGARLMFTTESPQECARVMSRYAGANSDFQPDDCTRGLYRRGVE